MADSTERERMVAGRTYRSTDPELTAMRAATKRVLHEYNNTHPDDEERRMELLRGFLGKVGQAWIEPPFRCDYGAQISLGEFVFANYDLTILDCAPVTIGDMVLFGPRVTLATASHPVDFRQRTVDMFEYVIVGPGVTIGARSVIGAGSIVTRDIPPDVVAVGNPCRVVREITEQDRADYLAAYGAASS
jgi:acetyltransferase-like isoleucine patch superfamily enzyme